MSKRKYVNIGWPLIRPSATILPKTY